MRKEVFSRLFKNPGSVPTNEGIHFVISEQTNLWSGNPYRLRPSDVRTLSEIGMSITATPHVGLLRAPVAMYPSMGVTVYEVMSNQSVRDNYGQPEYMFESGSKYHCAVQKEQLLSPYLMLEKEALSLYGSVTLKQFAQCRMLSHVHHIAKKQAIGASCICLDAELLEFPFVHSFFHVLCDHEEEIFGNTNDGIFNRFCSSRGEVTHETTKDRSQIEKHLEMRSIQKEMVQGDVIRGDALGYLPFNEAMVLLDIVTSWYRQLENGASGEHEIGDVFLVSGVDMINYLKSSSTQNLFSRMYRILLNDSNFQWLPKHMRCTLIPGGELIFLPSSGETELTDSVLSVIDANREVNESKNEITKVKNGGLPFWDLVGRNKILFGELKKRQQRFNAAHHTRRGFSQYDFLAGEFVPPQIINELMEIPFETISGLFKR